MKVILLGELRGKGGEGDVVDVAQGYAENMLFPKRLALPPPRVTSSSSRRGVITSRSARTSASPTPRP
jgi:large subunit ribosomal protein L9